MCHIAGSALPSSRHGKAEFPTVSFLRSRLLTNHEYRERSRNHGASAGSGCRGAELRANEQDLAGLAVQRKRLRARDGGYGLCDLEARGRLFFDDREGAVAL